MILARAVRLERGRGLWFAAFAMERRKVRPDQPFRVVFIEPVVQRRRGDRDAFGSDSFDSLAMAPQRPADDAVELQFALGEVAAEPTRLPVAEFGQPIVVVGAESGLRMPYQEELCHRRMVA